MTVETDCSCSRRALRKLCERRLVDARAWRAACGRKDISSDVLRDGSEQLGLLERAHHRSDVMYCLVEKILKSTFSVDIYNLDTKTEPYI